MCWRLLGHRAVRALVAREPALGGFQPAQLRQHPDPAEPELERDLLDLRVVRGQVAGYQPRIVRCGRQQVTGAQVTRL